MHANPKYEHIMGEQFAVATRAGFLMSGVGGVEGGKEGPSWISATPATTLCCIFFGHITNLILNLLSHLTFGGKLHWSKYDPEQ